MKTLYADCGNGIMVPLFVVEYPGRTVIHGDDDHLTWAKFERAVKQEFGKVTVVSATGRKGEFNAEVVK